LTVLASSSTGTGAVQPGWCFSHREQLFRRPAVRQIRAEVKIDGDLLIMKESDVMGVIEGASATKKKAA